MRARAVRPVQSQRGRSHGGVRFFEGAYSAPELQAFAQAIAGLRAEQGHCHGYPGSPLIAARELRTQDRAVFCELVTVEARALEKALHSRGQTRVEQGDGFDRIRAWLHRRTPRLIFIDPPYEETQHDSGRVIETVGDALQRFQTGVVAVWYPIKDERETAAWTAAFSRSVARETLLSEIWLYPRDSRVALNGQECSS